MAKVIFVQPFTVNGKLAEQAEGRVVVLDVAFNGGSPQGKGSLEEQFQNTTVAFIQALGSRLVAWVDHHPHAAWPNYANDSRFHLFSRETAPACPPIITVELVASMGQADTIIAHGDFDGVMSAVKFALGGVAPYAEADTDSIAADTRKGKLSSTGQRLEEAMKADLRDDSIRHAVFAELVTADEAASAKVTEAQGHYMDIQTETQRLALLFQVTGKVAHQDAADARGYDLTALLLAGQKTAGVAVVRNTQQGKSQITIAGPQSWNFVTLFGLAGGMPNRVNLPDQPIEEVVAKINEA